MRRTGPCTRPGLRTVMYNKLYRFASLAPQLDVIYAQNCVELTITAFMVTLTERDRYCTLTWDFKLRNSVIKFNILRRIDLKQH